MNTIITVAIMIMAIINIIELSLLLPKNGRKKPLSNFKLCKTAIGASNIVQLIQ